APQSAGMRLLQIGLQGFQGPYGARFVQLAARCTAHADGAYRVIADLDRHAAAQQQKALDITQIGGASIFLRTLQHGAGQAASRSGRVGLVDAGINRMRTGLVGTLERTQYAGAVNHSRRHVVTFGRTLLDGFGSQTISQIQGDVFFGQHTLGLGGASGEQQRHQKGRAQHSSNLHLSVPTTLSAWKNYTCAARTGLFGRLPSPLRSFTERHSPSWRNSESGGPGYRPAVWQTSLRDAFQPYGATAPTPDQSPYWSGPRQSAPAPRARARTNWCNARAPIDPPQAARGDAHAGAQPAEPYPAAHRH